MAKKGILEIDFLKGLAILWVICEHSFPSTIVESLRQYFPITAVPLFFSITFFLSFKKLSENRRYYDAWFNIKRVKAIWNKLLLPFLIVTFLGACIFVWKGGNISSIILEGGVGPGSYYIWVYIQIWLLIPLLFFILDRFNNYGIIIVFGLCIVLNVLCSILQIPDYLWRLLCVRYISLSVVGYMWLNQKRYRKSLVLLLGLLSYLYLIFLRANDYEPWIHNGGWSIHNYPCYFFTLALILLLQYVWRWFKEWRISSFFVWCGQNSWYIFLMQMLYLGFIDVNSFFFIQNSFIRKFIFLLSTFIFSIGFTFILEKLDNLIRIKN